MRLPHRARLVRIPLEGSVGAGDGALLVRGDDRPFALTGAWAGGGALVGSEPLVVADDLEDPFALVDEQPRVQGVDEDCDAVGGGWFGYLGYRLGARLEAVPPGPPRPSALPDFALAFYDHMLRLDAWGRWWFEALWSKERAPALSARRDLLARRLSAAARARPLWVGTFEVAPPGAAGHVAAVAECRERIAAGEIFQANLCLRLEAPWQGDPVDLFAHTAGALAPRHAALVAGPWGSLCSLSPELFLRRRGRTVLSEPIKGTAPRDGDGRAALAASRKDRAENVMIVDLMRNDLGRVCEYGSISVPELTQPRAAPGVWHLVSTVEGRVRAGVGDGDLLRSTFPPGSVTGAPKIQTMRVIAELEATGREAYTGAIGYASPVAGLELNVAIRTLEARGERLWLGAGGGIVADSDPSRELEEALLKARPLISAAGGLLAEPARPGTRRAVPALAFGTGGADRPDAALGVLSTLLVRDGEAVGLAAHLGRLEQSVEELYAERLPGDLEARVRVAAAGAPIQRLRILAEPSGGSWARVEIDARPLGQEPEPEPVTIAPVTVPGGLGAHKWRDRRLLAELERRLGAVPLLVDLDGEVLEVGPGNVWIVEGSALITPPLDGRVLPGTVRAAVLELSLDGLELGEQPIALERLIAADEVLLTSSVRGLHPAATAGSRACFAVGARVREALRTAPRSVRPGARPLSRA